MSTIRVNIVSANEAIFDGEAEMVFAPAVMGEVGILPKHTPLLTQLRPGTVRVRVRAGEERNFFVSGGILEVQPHMVSVLADTAVRARDLDEQAVLEAKQRAEDTLAERRRNGVDLVLAKTELAEALARLRLIQYLRERDLRH